MSVTFRSALRGDVPAILALLRDDSLGAAREIAAPDTYLAAFDEIAADPKAQIIAGVDETGTVVACAQLNIISGLSFTAARRALVEGVRVASPLRSQGVGAALMAECEARAKAAGCTLIQLTSNNSRLRAHAFYTRLGYAASHTGFKKAL